MEREHSSQGEWQVQSLREADAVSMLSRVSRRKEVEDDCTEGCWARSWSLVGHMEEASRRRVHTRAMGHAVVLAEGRLGP